MTESVATRRFCESQWMRRAMATPATRAPGSTADVPSQAKPSATPPSTECDMASPM